MRLLIFSFIFMSFSTLADLTINEAWIKNAPPVVPVRAAYLTLSNDADTPITIRKIISPQFDRVEAHETVIKNGVYSMKPLNDLMIKPHSTVTLKPKGKHLMLMMPTQSLNDLTHIQLEFQTNDDQIILVNAPIKN